MRLHAAKQTNANQVANQVVEHVARMLEEGLLTDKARAFATHIALDANQTHPELEALASPHNYEIAYDGLTV